jgi:hypothetical protein
VSQALDVDVCPAAESIGVGTVSLEGNHIFSGNPMRAKSGAVPFRIDEEWRVAMPRKDRLKVTAATWPLLSRYGYESW